MIPSAIVKESPNDNRGKDYIELVKIIKGKGFLGKQPAYYAREILTTLVLLAACIGILVFLGDSWFQLLNALFLALIFGRKGFIVHDAEHNQIFSSRRWNQIVGLSGGFFVGMMPSWWYDKHTVKHHSNPNDIDLDGDIDIPFLAFSEEQARRKKGLFKIAVRHQPWLYFPIQPLISISFRLAPIVFFFQNKSKVRYPWIEPLLMAAHFVIYFSALFYLLTPMFAILFIIVHHAAFGAYFGAVFAPNHKGMLIIDDNNRDMGFLRRQVLTARNVRGSWYMPKKIVTWLYGGLDYQITHHLFPTMSRNKLAEANKVVREFCERMSITCEEAGMIGSQWQILKHLSGVSKSMS